MEARRTQLIEEHLALVDHVVRRAAGSFPAHVDRSELASAGRLGLTEAASRYDFDSGVPFSSFAARRIRGSVLDLMRSTDWVPRSVRDVARRVDDMSVRLRNEGGDSGDDNLAQRLGIDTQRLRAVRSAAAQGQVSTLDRPAADGISSTGDALTDHTISSTSEVLENRELLGYLRSALASLPERLRVIVVGHYLEGRQLDELADLLGLTSSRVSQLRSDAVEILRHGIESQFEPVTEAKPKGRVEIRQAQFASSVARHADWRARLAVTRYGQSTLPTEQPATTEVIHSA